MIGGTGLQSRTSKFQGVATEAASCRCACWTRRAGPAVGRHRGARLDPDGREVPVRRPRREPLARQGRRGGAGLRPAGAGGGRGLGRGVVVVVSAGNYGDSGHYTVASPGNSRKVITVGSVTDQGSGTNLATTGLVASPRAVRRCLDKVLKPDLVAPGNRIVAPFAAGVTIGTLVPPDRGLLRDTAATTARGATCGSPGPAWPPASSAAPSTRMLEKDPTLSPSTVKARLMRSPARSRATPPRTAQA